MYICPMHPEIKSQKQDRCPKCGMKLVLQSEVAKNTSPSHTYTIKSSQSSWKNYTPLLVIIALITVTSLATSLQDFSITKLLMHFMTGFFLVFAGFKIIDLKGFAQGYSTYDLIAKKFYAYGYMYPFIELFFGLSMAYGIERIELFIVEFIVMVISGIGVAIKLLKHEKFECVCLGTFLKVPLTKVTLIEDFGMAALALVMILALYK